MKRTKLVSVFLVGFAAILTLTSQALGREPIIPSTLQTTAAPKFQPRMRKRGERNDL